MAELDANQIKKMTFIAIPLGIVMLLIVLVVTGKAGLKEIKDTEVALVYNYLTHSSEKIIDPGNKLFIPFIQEVFIFDQSPNKFYMKGDRDRDENTVKHLEVRANDGSKFLFEEMEIQYRILGSKVDILIHDSGTGNAFKLNWLRSYSRSILRDEFGRYSAAEIANATTYKRAKLEAKKRLQAAFEPHGIEIIQIVTPKPKFDLAYEKAIEDRKSANQEVEIQITMLEQLIQERERRLSNIKRDQAVLYEALLGELEAEKTRALTAQIKIEKSADAAKILSVSDGKAQENKLLQQARGLEEKYRKEAEGLKAQADALASQGEIIVRETLARKIREIEFSLVPYSKDSLPKRLEYEEIKKVGGKK